MQIVKTTIRKRDGEYIVRAYGANGERIPQADYFTDDKIDAQQTARAMMQTATDKMHALTGEIQATIAKLETLRAAYTAEVMRAVDAKEYARADGETVCHCGCDYDGSDHCPYCYCEQYQTKDCGMVYFPINI